APMYGAGGSQRGRAYVYWGGAAPGSIPDLVLTGSANGDQLGTVVGGAGDVNGDGHAQVLASAPVNDPGGAHAGAAYVWFGGPGMDSTPDLTVLGSAAGEQLTYASNAGDINADGYSDLIVSERHHVRVYLGGATPNSVPDLTLARNFVVVAGA